MNLLSLNELHLISGGQNSCYCEFYIVDAFVRPDRFASVVNFDNKQECFAACEAHICGKFEKIEGLHWIGIFEVKANNAKRLTFEDTGTCAS